MKSVTEFASFVLSKGLTAKNALLAEGKSPEEAQAALGETFKLEGEKLGHFVAALEVATSHMTNLRRILVVSFAEGENIPSQAVKVQEHYYVPEMIITAKPVSATDGDRKGGRNGGRGGKGKSGPKSSPWGMSPEEKAAKNKGPAKA